MLGYLDIKERIGYPLFNRIKTYPPSSFFFRCNCTSNHFLHDFHSMDRFFPQMKLFGALAFIASNLVIGTPAVSPENSEPLTVRQSTSPSTSAVMAPVLAQFWQTGISGFDQYSPSAAPGLIAALEQACATFNTIDTQGAELPQTNTFTYLLAPAFVSLWGSLFKDVNILFPLLPAGISVLMGNTSSIPALVTAAQAACDLIQNGGVEPRTIVPAEAKRGLLGSLVGRT